MSNEISSEAIEGLLNELRVQTDTPDVQTFEEIQKAILEGFVLRNADFAQNIEQRKIYADLIFTLVCIWLTIVMVVIIAVGMEKLKLSDTVISLLITSTTVNVCGFLLLVVKYLFNAESSSEQSKNKKKKKKN